jgi:hypothetical protein
MAIECDPSQHACALNAGDGIQLTGDLGIHGCEHCRRVVMTKAQTGQGKVLLVGEGLSGYEKLKLLLHSLIQET